MTLCTAWLRKVNNNNELVFATDSCLSAGERWPVGIKLFDFNRKDCLISFAGETYRAYPLILNAIHLLKTNSILSNPLTPLSIVKKELCDLFTNLTDKLYLLGSDDNKEELKAKAQFIFGGWDYAKQRFVAWHIFYNKDIDYQNFIGNEIYFDDPKPAFFIGDGADDALTLLFQNLKDAGKSENVVLDMEPFKILQSISLNDTNTYVSGPIQIAKVYQSGSNEFFGVIWPSSKGKPTFHGAEYDFQSSPFAKYIDPDTAQIMEENIPSSNIGFTKDDKYQSFLDYCYPKNKLNHVLTENEKEKLILVLKDIAYSKFLSDLTEINKELENTREENEDATEVNQAEISNG